MNGVRKGGEGVKIVSNIFQSLTACGQGAYRFINSTIIIVSVYFVLVERQNSRQLNRIELDVLYNLSGDLANVTHEGNLMC